MLAAHGIEQQRKVLDIARHRALHPEIAIDLGNGSMGHAADARPHAGDAAEACRIAQRAAHVGAVRKPRHAGCERNGGTARGAGSGARCIPGITRRAEYLIEGVGAGAEFRRIRLGVNQPSVIFETFDQQGQPSIGGRAW